MKPSHLDERFVPRLAAVLQRSAGRWRARWLRLTAPGTMLGDAAREQSALAGSIAAVLIAALILAGAGGPGGPPADNGPNPTGGAVPVPVAVTLGPVPGTDVANYLPRARHDLLQFVARSRGRLGYAVIDFSRDLTPAQTMALMAHRNVVRAYLRVPSALPTQVHAIPLQGNFGPLRAGMLQSGHFAATTAKTFRALVVGIHPNNPADRKLRSRYRAQQLASAYEAQQLLHPATCACIYSVVIHADATALVSLAHTSGVRVVDPAPPTVGLDELTVFPLEPSVVGIVPRGGLFGA